MPKPSLLLALALLAACRSTPTEDDPEAKARAQSEAERGKAHTEGQLDRHTDNGGGAASAAPAVPNEPGAAVASSGAVQRQDIDGMAHYVVEASASGDGFDTARNAAVAAARAALAEFQRVEVKRDFASIFREQIRGDGGELSSRYREEVEGVTVTRARAQLASCRVVSANASRDPGGRFVGVAKVACPESVLFPGQRLAALLRRADAGLPDYERLAVDYEREGHMQLAEQALRLAYDRLGGAPAALAVAKHFGRRGIDRDALRWYRSAAREAGSGTALAVEADVRARQITEGLASARSLADELVALATRRQDRTRMLIEARRATGRSDGVDWQVWWHLRDAIGECRLLKMWYDDTLTPAWWAEGETDAIEASARDGYVEFTLPRGTPTASVMVWALPLDSELWPRLVALRNVELGVGGEVSDEDRMTLRDVLQGLTRSSAVAGVVSVGG